MSVTIYERSGWRALCSQGKANHAHASISKGDILRLLDGLDDAEADKAMLFDEAVRQKKRAIEAEARAEKAERERDVLARAAFVGCYCCPVMACNGNCFQSRLAWAAAEAAKGER